MRLLLTLSLPFAALLAVDIPGPDFQLYSQGKYVYERNCLVCHGPRGDGTGELSKGLAPKPRSFREGMFKFRSTPAGALPLDEDLKQTIRGGLSGTAMGMFTQLPEEDLEAVITYVKSFSRRWRKAENYSPALPLPPVPDWMGAASTAASHAAAGKPLFQTHCAVCHNTTGDGLGPAAALLKDIWGQSVLPTDLRQPHLRCGDEPADLFRLLSTGMNGTPMLSYATLLTPAQRWDITAYVLSLRKPH